MERGGKIALFWLYYPTPKASDIQCQEETPHLERVLLLGKQRAEWVAFCTSFFFFFFFWLFYVDLLQFHLHEEISKAEAPRDGQWQERKEEATNTSHTIGAMGFPVKCSVGNLSSFWHWRNQKPAQLPQITWRFHQLSSLFCHWPVPLYSLFQLHIWQPFPTSHHQPPPLLAQQSWQWTLQPEEGEGYSFHCAYSWSQPLRPALAPTTIFFVTGPCYYTNTCSWFPQLSLYTPLAPVTITAWHNS